MELQCWLRTCPVCEKLHPSAKNMPHLCESPKFQFAVSSSSWPLCCHLDDITPHTHMHAHTHAHTHTHTHARTHTHTHAHTHTHIHTNLKLNNPISLIQYHCTIRSMYHSSRIYVCTVCTMVAMGTDHLRSCVKNHRTYQNLNQYLHHMRLDLMEPRVYTLGSL